MPRVSRLSRRGRAASSPSCLVSENLNHPKNKGAPSFRVLCGKVETRMQSEHPPGRLGQPLNRLGIDQPAVSKMERRADVYISTPQSMIRAMGGTNPGTDGTFPIFDKNQGSLGETRKRPVCPRFLPPRFLQGSGAGVGPFDFAQGRLCGVWIEIAALRHN